MIKQLSMVSIKPGMSREAFIDRYENGHTPLALRIVNYFADYRRNYVVPGGGVGTGHLEAAGKPEFDEVSEFWYKDQSWLDRLAHALGATDVGDQITRDEEDLFDRSTIRLVRVDEYVTPDNQFPSGNGREKPEVKLFVLANRRPGMSRADFIDYYENKHAALALSHCLDADGQSFFAAYRRNYPVEEGVEQLPHLDAAAPAVGFDVLTELWFWTEADLHAFQAHAQSPAFVAALTADEVNLFDRSSIRMLRVDEYITPADQLAGSGSYRPELVAG